MGAHTIVYTPSLFMFWGWCYTVYTIQYSKKTFFVIVIPNKFIWPWSRIFCWIRIQLVSFCVLWILSLVERIRIEFIGNLFLWHMCVLSTYAFYVWWMVNTPFKDYPTHFVAGPGDGFKDYPTYSAVGPGDD